MPIRLYALILMAILAPQIAPAQAPPRVLGGAATIALMQNDPLPPLPPEFEGACPVEARELVAAWAESAAERPATFGWYGFEHDVFKATPFRSVEAELAHQERLRARVVQQANDAKFYSPAVGRMGRADTAAQFCASRARLGQRGPINPPGPRTPLTTTPTPAPAPSQQTSASTWPVGSLLGGMGGIPGLAASAAPARPAAPTPGLDIMPAYRRLNFATADAFMAETKRQQGKTRRYHNSANDVTACLKVQPTGTRQEWGTSGKMKLVNSCGFPVAASWCANAQDCAGGHGNLWTIDAGKDWPLFFSDPQNPHIEVGGCRTAATASPPPPPGAPAPLSKHQDPQPAAGVTFLHNHTCD